ncbi:MAG: hypothetical protein HKP30_13215 [Myxococcales bacterium]|nr:hypothetical protein [Myxococcales bacterium]
MRPATPSARPSPSPLEWLCLAAGLVLLLRYAWLMDDAYVYFRYVDNWVFLGHGLVYNRGEYLEGFSSPLWALLLGLLRRSTIGYWILVRLLGVVSFVVIWWALVRLNRRLAPPGAPAVNLPLLFVAFAYGPLCYFTSGLETPLVQVAAPIYALFLVSPAGWGLEIALALSPLLRHELALALGLVALFVWARDGRFPWRLFFLSAAFTGGWLLFRVWYYADLFQNTFYLKNLVDVPQGLVYLRNTTDTYALGAWLLLHAGLLVWLFRARSRPAWLAERAVMIGVSLALTAYVVKIGGDPRHYRFLAFPFVLTLCALSGLLEAAIAQLPAARRGLVAGAAGLAIGAFALSAYPPQLREHPIWLGDQAVMVDKIKDAAEHRRMELLTPPLLSSGASIEQLDDYRRRDARGKPYDAVYHESGCVYLYQAWDRYALHTLGLTDGILGRTDMVPDRPAHKLGLIPLAQDMRPILREVRGRPHRGMYRAAVERGAAPAWIERNLETIELIERKLYNRHDFVENLGLALSFPDRIDPGPRREPR